MATSAGERVTANLLKPSVPAAPGARYSQYPVGSFQDLLPERDQLGRRWGVFEQMRRDPVIAAALAIKTWLVVSDGWEVHPYDETEAASDMAEFAKYALENAKGTVEDLVDMILDAVPIGFSVTEKVYTVAEGGKYDGAYLPSYFGHVNPSFVGFDIGEFGEVSVTLRVPGTVSDAQVQPPEKFIVYTYGGRYGSPYGMGDFIKVYRSWWNKDSALKWWSVRTELTGVPSRIGKYPAGASPAVQNALGAAISKTAANNTFTISADTELEFWEPAGNGESLEKFVAFHNKEIIQGILGSVLLMDEGQRVGSLALGKVQLSVSMAQVNRLKRSVAEDPLGGLVKQIVDLNYSAQEVARIGGYPRFAFPMPSSDKLTEKAAVVAQMLQERVLDPVADNDAIREDLGLWPATPEFEQAVTDRQAQADEIRQAAARTMPPEKVPVDGSQSK